MLRQQLSLTLIGDATPVGSVGESANKKKIILAFPRQKIMVSTNIGDSEWTGQAINVGSMGSCGGRETSLVSNVGE